VAENGHQLLIGDLVHILAKLPACHTWSPVCAGFGLDLLNGLDHGTLCRAVAFGGQCDLAA